MPERNDNDVYMCVVTVNDGTITAIPVSYNIFDGGTAHAVSDKELNGNANADLMEFVDKAIDELDDLFTRMVSDAKTQIEADDIERGMFFVQMVANLQRYPVELIHNILASIFVNVIGADADIDADIVNAIEQAAQISQTANAAAQAAAEANAQLAKSGSAEDMVPDQGPAHFNVLDAAAGRDPWSYPHSESPQVDTRTDDRIEHGDETLPLTEAD